MDKCVDETYIFMTYIFIPALDFPSRASEIEIQCVVKLPQMHGNCICNYYEIKHYQCQLPLYLRTLTLKVLSISFTRKLCHAAFDEFSLVRGKVVQIAYINYRQFKNLSMLFLKLLSESHATIL
jgi:hypothetical protein